MANESKEADRVKKDVPVMVVMGNPPYSGHSSNKNDFIDKLLEDYKKESDGSKLKEKNPKWLNDDYVKFIRYSESYIDKNQEGILGFITNHSYIDNPTFRGMRYHLLKTFDKIYIIDLHGDSKKKETAPDGSKDENVFDIMQGVAIIIAIKKKQKSKKLAELYLCDIYGKRDYKYEFLTENSLKSLPFEKIEFKEPDFYFKSQNFQKLIEYEKNFKINELFTINSAGIVTARDGLVIDENEHKLKDRILNFYEDKEMILKENENFKIDKIRNNFTFDEKYIKIISHRIFDNKFIYYHSPFIERDRFNVMRHFNKNNLGIAISRQCQDDWKHIFISKNITDFNLTGTAGKFGSGYLCPLYLYPDENSLTNERTPNLNLEIVKEIEEKLALKFVNEKIEDSTTFAPIDILDYIYAVLHSPSYREKYKEFLKIDFPRVPYPKPETFWQQVSLGAKLRSLHLLEDRSLDERIIDIKGEGELLIKNSLNKKDFTIEDEKVELRLNDEVSVVNIPLVAWEFYIGGYQPAQKWLKDRVGRVLNRADMKHYNCIINALCKTDLIMKKIDEVAKF
ncbi:type ISP restriction/modification enzyme [Aliarcobacter skirrowii]|uniref:type ISP restriction/modification enzyme n=1 Tax=Aliarcobacter skirrowii TaxID=28200 RepID=UPI003208D1E5